MDDEDVILDELYDMLNDEGWTESNLCCGMVIINNTIYRMDIIAGLTFYPVE